MTAKALTVLITGANQGIGFSTAEILARSTSPTYHVFLCSRDQARGDAAAAKLAHLPGKVEALQLDVSSAKSVAAAAEYVSKTTSVLDILINNAGVALDPQPKTFSEKLRETFETNVVGAAEVTEAFLPLLQKSTDPRLIFVSSGLGSLALATDKKSGYSGEMYPSYRVSKTALNMLMVYYSAKLKDVKVWTMCPGYRATNLNAYAGTGSVEGGAQVVVDIAIGKRDGEVGQYVHEHGVYPW